MSDFFQAPATPRSPRWPLSIGPPVWGCEHWGGQVYPVGTSQKDYLRWYSRTFNVVEGNSTFYGLPGPATFQKWADSTEEGFEFCLKFPRVISHDAMLENCQVDLEVFMDRLEILAGADRLGPTFLQLGPNFGPERFGSLEKFLRSLSEDFPWAVEVRHPGWFDDDERFGGQPSGGEISYRGCNEQRLDELLRTLGIDKVLFDSSALFSRDPDDEIETVSQSRKPNPPHRQTVTAGRPMIRMVGRNQTVLAEPFIKTWTPVVADWIGRGLRPIVFTHAPDDKMAPAFARLWMETLAIELPDVDLSIPVPPATAVQPTLFDLQ